MRVSIASKLAAYQRSPSKDSPWADWTSPCPFTRPTTDFPCAAGLRSARLLRLDGSLVPTSPHPPSFTSAVSSQERQAVSYILPDIFQGGELPLMRRVPVVFRPSHLPGPSPPRQTRRGGLWGQAIFKPTDCCFWYGFHDEHTPSHGRRVPPAATGKRPPHPGKQT